MQLLTSSDIERVLVERRKPTEEEIAIADDISEMISRHPDLASTIVARMIGSVQLNSTEGMAECLLSAIGTGMVAAILALNSKARGIC